VIRLLAARNLTLKPWRSVFLLFGFSMGVAVMIVLLSIGEALLDQSRDERLVGGGDITVLPEGVDVEVLKTGGLGGLFFSIDHARFIYRQLLAAPRLQDAVTSVSPQIEGKLVYLRTSDGRERPVRASADIPSRTAALGGGLGGPSGEGRGEPL
jgi:ABC-type lipoprotein release transport system permease subunit